MKTDKDLRFLSSCENEDLRVLCDILTHDRLGNIRVTEQLTATDEYNRNYPEDMLFLVPQISNELLKYGSNTLTTFWHNEPDSYQTVLRRVCKQMDVRTMEQDSVTKMERNLLTTLCQDTLNKMSERELRLLANENGIPDKRLTRQALTAALLMAIRTSRAVLTRIAARVIQYIVEIITIRGVSTKHKEAERKLQDKYDTDIQSIKTDIKTQKNDIKKKIDKTDLDNYIKADEVYTKDKVDQKIKYIWIAYGITTATLLAGLIASFLI